VTLLTALVEGTGTSALLSVVGMLPAALLLNWANITCAGTFYYFPLHDSHLKVHRDWALSSFGISCIHGDSRESRCFESRWIGLHFEGVVLGASCL
jgi:hypothetical protein